MGSETISALTGLGHEYEAIAHNLANANTVGFKRQIGVFTQEPPKVGVGAQTSASPTSSLPATKATSAIDFSQGRLVQTGRSLDVALSGKGFFVLETSEGERYTRNGVFRVNSRGQLVDAAGRTVAGTGGPVVIPSSVSSMEVEIGSDGRIFAAGTPIGALRIVEFEDPSVLQPEGMGAFVAKGRTQPGPAANTTVQQGCQEASNVDTVRELVALIKVTRLYQANVQVMAGKSDRGKDLMRVAMA